jgi:putative transcriptional regulator
MTITKSLVVKQPEIGDLIRELQLLTSLTQEQFAAHIGVTYPTINRWENKQSSPSPIAPKALQVNQLISKSAKCGIVPVFVSKHKKILYLSL